MCLGRLGIVTRLLVLAATLVLAMVLAACGGGDDTTDAEAQGETTSAEAGSPVVVAFPGAQSGFLSLYDETIRKGMELAVEDINAEGGVLDGRELELAVGPDNKSDINGTRDAALQALTESPDFLVTSCDYDFGSPQARAANEQGVLAVGCAGSVNYGLEGIGPLTFNTSAANPTEAAVLGEFTAAEFPNAYFITDTSTAYTKEVCELAVKSFEEAGGTTVGEDTMNNSDSSFAAQVNRFRGDGGDAEAIVLCSYIPGGANVIKQFRAAGIDLPIVGDAAFGGSTWFEQVPQLGEFYSAGEVASINGDDPDPKKNELVKRYEKKYGEPPSSGQMVIGYATIEALARAVDKAGETDAEAVKGALESFDEEPLLVGDTTYTSDCHIPLGRPLVVLKAEGDSAVFVESITPKNVNSPRC